MKIGIITLFDLTNVNYGNRLQAYALNHFINTEINCEYAQTLYFKDFKDFKRTKQEPILSRIKRKISRDIINRKDKKIPEELQVRQKLFNDFCVSNMNLVKEPLSQKNLEKQEFDVIIVGSDVVWYQWEYGIRPIKLLDFNIAHPFRKISYAASFGNNRIPTENINELKRCLNNFYAISVREKSGLELLKQFGITNAQHVLDPTLLIDKEKWFSIEQPVKQLENKRYIFAYLLNNTKEDRLNVIKIAKFLNLPVVTIPYASGRLNVPDRTFGDHRILDCSLQEWIWLIHNAEYIITDSFHGAAFSTNFQKKFVVTKRKEKFDMNARLFDFLNLINESDKYINLSEFETIKALEWDYNAISKIIEEKCKESKKFIRNALI